MIGWRSIEAWVKDDSPWNHPPMLTLALLRPWVMEGSPEGEEAPKDPAARPGLQGELAILLVGFSIFKLQSCHSSLLIFKLVKLHLNFVPDQPI